jgi:hypothetical protein
VAPLVAPVHVARQSGAVAPPALACPKGSDLQIFFLGLVLKYCLKRIKIKKILVNS